MWQYTYTDELYHFGIPGMKWGHRKARPSSGSISRSQKKAIRRELKNEKRTKQIKDNDRRVRMYGKNMVRAGNAIGIASTVYGMNIGNQLVKDFGMSSMRSIAANPRMSNGKLHATSLLTAAGMGAITVSSLSRIKKHVDDIRLTNDYEYRKYMKKKQSGKK